MANTITHEINDGFGAPRFIERIRHALAEYRLYRETVDELRSLSDRELNDLGLSRFDVQRVARESVYGA